MILLFSQASLDTKTGIGEISYLSSPSAFHSKTPKSVVWQSKAFQAGTKVHKSLIPSEYPITSLLEIIVPSYPNKSPVKS